MGRNTYAASSWSRLVAYVIDVGATAFFLIPAAWASYLLDTPNAGALEFSIFFFAYQAYFLRFRAGSSLGKAGQRIFVSDLDGTGLSTVQVLGRAGLVSLPWVCIGLADLAAIHALLPPRVPAALPVLGLAWAFADLVLLEFVPSRRSLTDRVVGTIVLNTPPLQPHRAPAIPMFSANDAEFGNPPRRPRD